MCIFLYCLDDHADGLVGTVAGPVGLRLKRRHINSLIFLVFQAVRAAGKDPRTGGSVAGMGQGVGTKGAGANAAAAAAAPKAVQKSKPGNAGVGAARAVPGAGGAAAAGVKGALPHMPPRPRPLQGVTQRQAEASTGIALPEQSATFGGARQISSTPSLPPGSGGSEAHQYKRVHWKALLGKLVWIWWPLEDSYYRGVVESYSASNKSYFVRCGLPWRCIIHMCPVCDHRAVHPDFVCKGL